MVCGIYYILNKENGKIYIGQSVNVDRRLSQHKTELNGNYHKNEHLQYAWNKYGEDAFDFSLLRECDESELDDLEIHFISKYGSLQSKKGYNSDSGGHENKRLSEEHKQKLSKNHADVSGRNNPMYGKTGEYAPNWGTSVVDEWGGVWFLKTLIGAGFTISQITDYTGISKASINGYLKTRDYNWLELKKEVTGDKGHSIINEHGGLDFIIECIKEGKTQKDIAKEIGVERGSIRSYLKSREHTWAKLKKEVTGLEGHGVINERGGLDFIIECIKEGKTQKDIANELGLSHGGSIYCYLNDRGYSWTELKKEILGYGRKSIIDEYGGMDFIVECIKEGKTQKDIAEELEIDRKTVHSYIKNRGYSWIQLKEEIDVTNINIHH